MERENKRDVRM